MINYFAQLYPQEGLPIFWIDFQRDKSSLAIHLEPTSGLHVTKVVHFKTISNWTQDEEPENDVRETIIGFDIVREFRHGHFLWEINTDAATYNFTSSMPTVSNAI